MSEAPNWRTARHSAVGIDHIEVVEQEAEAVLVEEIVAVVEDEEEVVVVDIEAAAEEEEVMVMVMVMAVAACLEHRLEAIRHKILNWHQDRPILASFTSPSSRILGVISKRKRVFRISRAFRYHKN